MRCWMVGCGAKLGGNAGCSNRIGAVRADPRFRRRPLVTRFPWVIFSALALLLLACSEVTPTPNPRAAALWERAEQLYAAINDERWRTVHGFVEPEFQKICTDQEYAAIIELGVTMFRAIANLNAVELQFRVVDTLVEADQGKVYTQVLVNGKPSATAFSEEPEEWVYIDGQWWSQIKATRATCSGLE